ncbi:sigma-70 family RNA polymerase sigma factor [Bacillus sp. FJAT-49736]|uniref:sigma-70 family RNA polymerase sigma factor n=1 Tax=Bacillus sp. FJAT-49736 TaxID=2833582 RepID=UPI001BC9C5DF|nr:sigma-70 family RNA polymerase sigma factor [Bacillus sp. FJAT-49736]MBS4175596.1 sigma-70 family RNA polymerase sigma factor [Bacillus sp. FJAT-49736]
MEIFQSFHNASEDNSFDKLIRAEQEKLYRVAYSYVKNEQDALDIVQDTIIKSYKSFHKLSEIEYFSTWITRILINTALDHLKKNKNVIPLDLAPFISGYNEEDFSITKMDISSIFEKLKPQQKTLIILRFYYGYSIQEISELMDKPEGTIKSQLHRTLKKFGDFLGEGGDLYGEAPTRY